MTAVILPGSNLAETSFTAASPPNRLGLPPRAPPGPNAPPGGAPPEPVGGGQSPKGGGGAPRLTLGGARGRFAPPGPPCPAGLQGPDQAIRHVHDKQDEERAEHDKPVI